jgi:hypothetical protein
VTCAGSCNGEMQCLLHRPCPSVWDGPYDRTAALARMDAARQHHSDTSVAAAKQIAPVAGSLQAEVLDLLTVCGPMTDQQMQDTLELDPSTQRPRRIELMHAGFVRDSGERGITISGRLAVKWEAV